MQIRWRLRMTAAQREVWTGAELRRLLIDKAGLELSSPSISALLTKQPTQIKLETLLALCTALECSPNDLFEIDATPLAKVADAKERTPNARHAQSGSGQGRRTPPPF
jgi:putative transcriptional regulator